MLRLGRGASWATAELDLTSWQYGGPAHTHRPAQGSHERHWDPVPFCAFTRASCPVRHHPAWRISLPTTHREARPPEEGCSEGKLTFVLPLLLLPRGPALAPWRSCCLGSLGRDWCWWAGGSQLHTSKWVGLLNCSGESPRQGGRERWAVGQTGAPSQTHFPAYFPSPQPPAQTPPGLCTAHLYQAKALSAG